MGKTFFSFVLLITLTFSVNSQEISNNAIGVRLGNNSSFGSEISYQSLIGYTNRLEIDLAIQSKNGIDTYKTTGVFHWIWTITEKFNWYIGFGGGIGNYRNSTISKIFYFSSGDIGLEYNFEAPFLISFNYRPEYGYHEVYKGFNSDAAISLRYQF